MIPLPTPTSTSAPHWEGCRKGELRAQHCPDCDAWVFIPQPICPTCLSTGLEWVTSSGQGRVYSYTVVHRPQQTAFETPYVVAIVELDEGFTMLTNLVDCDPEEVNVGLAVEVAFRAMTDEITLPYFRPCAVQVPSKEHR